MEVRGLDFTEGVENKLKCLTNSASIISYLGELQFEEGIGKDMRKTRQRPVERPVK